MTETLCIAELTDGRMTETLCIAELTDGRRALVYRNDEEQKARLVIVLRPDDLQPKPQRRPETRKVPLVEISPEHPEGIVIGEIEITQELAIPPKPRPKPITAADLLNMHVEPTQEPQTREDELQKRIDDMLRGE